MFEDRFTIRSHFMAAETRRSFCLNEAMHRAVCVTKRLDPLGWADLFSKAGSGCVGVWSSELFI